MALSGVALGIGALVLLRGTGPSAPPATPPPRTAPTDIEAPAIIAPPDELPDSQPAPTSSDMAPAAPATAAAPARPLLTVLNNSRIPTLAERAAARYRAAGWPVAVVGSFGGRIVATTVYYAPGQRSQAQAVAAQFGVPRVLPRFAGLPGRGLTIVVTRDLASGGHG